MARTRTSRTSEETVKAYLAFLEDVYINGYTSPKEKQYNISTTACSVMRKEGWLEKANGKPHYYTYKWLLPIAPDKYHAKKLVGMVSKYAMEKTMLRAAKVTPTKPSISFPSEINIESILNYLKNDPNWEYSLTRKPKVAKEEVLL